MARDEPGDARVAQRTTQDARADAQRGDDAAEARIGELVAGTHRLERVLCRCPVGTLYDATLERIDRRLTLLRLRAPPTTDTARVEEAVRDVRALVRLGHPAVVDLHDVLLGTDGALYLVLERVEGETLAAYLRARGRLEPEHAITLLAPVLDALASAHRRGLVHGALGPESVIVTRTPARIVPKLVDLGLARLCSELGGEAPEAIPRAPEHALGAAGRIGPWTDVWSLGALTYACLAGTGPFAGDADAAAVAAGAIVPIESRRPGLPEAVILSLRRALARDPAHRFRDAGELRAALAPYELGPPAAEREPIAGVAKIAGVSVILVAALGGALATAMEHRPAPARDPAAIASIAPHQKRAARPLATVELRSGCWPAED